MGAMRAALVLLVVGLVGCTPSTPSADAGDAGGDGQPIDAPTESDATPDGDASVTAESVFDLGHVCAIVALQRSGTRAASVDSCGHWVLWNLDTHAQVTSGDLPCSGCGPVDLKGGALLARASTTSLDVIDANGGTKLATFAGASNAGLASDASYVWVGGAQSLDVRAVDGTLLFTTAGDYTQSRVFAAHDALRVASSTSLRIVQIPGYSSTNVPFSGTFSSWFLDGERFLATTGNAVWVYAKDGTQITARSLPSVVQLTGQGSFVWTCGASLQVYAVADLSTPLSIAGGCPAMASGSALVTTSTSGESATLQVATLGATSSTTSVSSSTLSAFSAFGADSNGNWIVGDGNGLVRTGEAIAASSMASLSYGVAWSLTGSPSGRGALATAAGTTLVFDVGPTTTSHALELASSHLELSDDGATLVASGYLNGAQYHDDRSLHVVSPTDGTVLHTWPYHWSDYPNLFFDYSFASGTKILCQLVGSSWLFTDVAGNALAVYGPPATWNGTSQLPRFSPDGSHAAFFDGNNGPYPNTINASYALYANGQSSGTLAGALLGWIDDAHFLAATYAFAGLQVTQQSVLVYDGNGIPTQTVTLPDLSGASIVSVGGTLVYAPSRNAVFDDSAGTTYWQGVQGDSSDRHARVGDYVLSVHGHRVLVERWR